MNARDANHVKALIESALNRRGVSHWGLVTSVNPADATAKVMLQPDGVETGWLPIKCVAAGPVNIMALPSIGDQVQVHCDGGDAEQGVISAASHGGQNQPPVSPATGKPAQAGECLIQIGSLYFHMAGGRIYMGGGDIVQAGNIIATGNVTAGQGSSAQVDLLGHKHPVQHVQGGDATIVSQPPMPGT